MPRTTIPGASTLGVTAQDVEAARAERDRLQSQHTDATARAQTRLNEMKEANGGTLPATAETREEVRELFATADQLGAQVDEARDHVEDLQGRLYGRDVDDRMPTATASARGHLAGPSLQAFSLASRLVTSDAYVAARENGMTGLAAWKEALGVAGALVVATRPELIAVLSPSTAAATLEPLVGDDQRRLFPPQPFPLEQVTLLDLISITETDKDNVDYAVTTNEQGNVTGAPYGTAFGQMTITTEARAEAVKRRGVLLDVPEGVLSDESRLKSWLEQRFRRYLRLDTEQQMLFGDGAGQNFTGVTNWAGVGSRQRAAGEAIADTIHNAMTDIRIAYHDEPNAIAFRPETWHDLLTDRDANGAYKNTGGPFGAMPGSMWGKQAVSTTALRDGTGNAGADPLDCIVGAWSEAELAAREGVEVRDFEQNKDNIEKGMVTIRGQYRGAFILNEPVAFSVVNLEESA